MHEPAGRGRLAPIKAFAIEPEAMAHSVFDEVIVARRLWWAVLRRLAPPFSADAFRALRARDLVNHPAPAKTSWRTVRDDRHDLLGRLGMGQQQQRPRFLLRFRPWCGNLTGDRQRSFGTLRNVTGDRFEPPYALRSKTLPQRIDQDRATRHFARIAGV